MWLRFRLKDPAYRPFNPLISERDRHVGKIRRGEYINDFRDSHAYALDLIPKGLDLIGTGFHGARWILPGATGPQESDAERALVLRAHTTGDAQYLRSMPSPLIRSYLIRQVLVEFEMAVDLDGLIEEPEALETGWASLPTNRRRQFTQFSRINFIEIGITPLTWEDIFFTPALVTVEKARREIEVEPIVGYLELIDTHALHGERMPAFILPRNVPKALEWLTVPHFGEEPSD